MKLAQGQVCDSRIESELGPLGVTDWRRDLHGDREFWSHIEELVIVGRINDVKLNTKVAILYWTYDLNDNGGIKALVTAKTQRVLPVRMTLKNKAAVNFMEFRDKVFAAISDQLDANDVEMPMSLAGEAVCPNADTQEMDQQAA